jgi:hypothetical protein
MLQWEIPYPLYWNIDIFTQQANSLFYPNYIDTGFQLSAFPLALFVPVADLEGPNCMEKSIGF